MAQKFLYIVDHFIPFPTSEYGGVWNVIAEDDDECFDLIANDDDGVYERFYINLRENVQKATSFALLNGEESRIVERFTT